MAITETKTWEYTVNLIEAVGGGQTDRNQRLFLALKRALTDTGGNPAVDASGASISLTAPWVVVASSDSVTADATDRWLDSGDIIGASAGNPHSHIHLRQTDFYGPGDHLHLLIDCINVSVLEVARVSWTRGATGYNADGTTTNRPTHAESTDELITRSGVTSAGDAKTSDMMWGTDSFIAQTVLHVRIADDGSAGAWYVTAGGACMNWQGWQIEEDGEPAETHPFVVWAAGLDGTNLEVVTWAALINTLSIFRGLDGAGFERNYFACQPVGTSTEQRLSDLNASTTRFLMPIYLVDNGNTTIRGTLTDQWWGSSLEVTGDGAPAGGPVIRRQIGETVIGWPSGVGMTVT